MQFPSPIYGASFKPFNTNSSLSFIVSVSVPYIRGQFQTSNQFEIFAYILISFRPLYTGLVSNVEETSEQEHLLLFPSPIYGASFKLENGYVYNEGILVFPSPIYGASFKQFKNQVFEEEQKEEFPSPIYGASFKLKKYSWS